MVHSIFFEQEHQQKSKESNGTRSDDLSVVKYADIMTHWSDDKSTWDGKKQVHWAAGAHQKYYQTDSVKRMGTMPYGGSSATVALYPVVNRTDHYYSTLIC